MVIARYKAGVFFASIDRVVFLPAKILVSFYRQKLVALFTWQKRLVAEYCKPTQPSELTNFLPEGCP
jgi:hypothetical protein